MTLWTLGALTNWTLELLGHFNDMLWTLTVRSATTMLMMPSWRRSAFTRLSWRAHVVGSKAVCVALAPARVMEEAARVLLDRVG